MFVNPISIVCIGIAVVPFVISALLRIVGGYGLIECLLLWIGLTSALGFSFYLVAINDFYERIIKVSDLQHEELQRIRECVISVSSRDRDFSN